MALNELYFTPMVIDTVDPLFQSKYDKNKILYDKNKYPLMKWHFSTPIEQILSFRRLNPLIPKHEAKDCTFNCLKFLGVINSDIAHAFSESIASMNYGIFDIERRMITKSIQFELENYKKSVEYIYFYLYAYNVLKKLGNDLNNGEFILISGYRKIKLINGIPESNRSGHTFILTKIDSILYIFDPQQETLHADIPTEYEQSGDVITVNHMMTYLSEYDILYILIERRKRLVETFEHAPRERDLPFTSSKRAKNYNKITIPKNRFSENVGTLTQELNYYKDIIPQGRERIPDDLTHTSQALIGVLDELINQDGIPSDDFFQDLNIAIQDVDDSIDIDYEFKEEIQNLLEEFYNIIKKRSNAGKNVENMRNIWTNIFSFYKVFIEGSSVSEIFNNWREFKPMIPSLKKIVINLVKSINSYKSENTIMYDTSISMNEFPSIDQNSEPDNLWSLKEQEYEKNVDLDETPDVRSDDNIRSFPSSSVDEYDVRIKKNAYDDLNKNPPSRFAKSDEDGESAYLDDNQVSSFAPSRGTKSKWDDDEESADLDDNLLSSFPHRLAKPDDDSGILHSELSEELQEEMELQRVLDRMHELTISITEILDSINKVNKLLRDIRDGIDRYKYEFGVTKEAPSVEFYGGKSRKIKKRNVKTRKSKNKLKNKSKNKLKNKSKNKLFYWQNKK